MSGQIDILGVPVDRATMSETIARIVSAIASGEQIQHMAVNPGKIVQAANDPVFRDMILAADLFTADGVGVIWAAKLLGLEEPSRITGIDLMKHVIAAAAEHGFRVYFLGAKHEVVAQVVDHYQEQYPSLQVAGFRDGYFTDEEEPVIAQQIRDSRADILLVAISSPKKEEFLGRNRQIMGLPFCMGVGGSFDVVAGKVQRAPGWMQKIGMEWLYRVAQEPGRMVGRKAQETPLFLSMIARAWVQSRVGVSDPEIDGNDGANPGVLVVGPWTVTAGGVLTFQKNLTSSEDLQKQWRFLPFNISRPPKENVDDNHHYGAILNDGMGRLIRGAVITAVNVGRFSHAAQRAQVLQIQSSDYYSFWEAMLYTTLAQRQGCPVVVRFGGGSFNKFYEDTHPTVRRMIVACLRKPDAIVVQSPNWKRYFSRFVKEEQLNIIPNAVTHPVEPRASWERKGPVQALFICTNEARRKGIAEVLEAAPHWRGQVELTFVAASETVREKVTSLGLDDMVAVHGVVSRDEMRTRFYPDADIFLLPSHGEGFPNSLLEAMAAGLPVVTCPVGAIPEVIHPGVHGFLNPPGDAAGLTRDVLTLAGDPALRQQMGEANQACVQEEYGHEVVFSRFDAVWKAAIARQRRRWRR